MKISQFDGGLSTRIDATLVQTNEGVIFNNIDTTSKLLKSVNDYRITSQEVQGQFYNFKGSWLNSANERSYVEYKDKVYFTEKDKLAKKFNGFREVNLGIAPPTVKLTTVQADPIATEKISTSVETLQYTYTYYNSEDGIESAPAPISDELTLAANKVVDISDFIPSSDVQVDKIKLYRIGADATAMTLVTTVINAGAVIRDSTPTVDLPGTLLDSYSNQAPIIGLQYLTEAYGIMFAALGDKLYFSKIGAPDYWPAAQYLDFARDITGILPVPNGLLVFSEFKTDILVGTKAEDFKVLPLSTEQGSVSHLSGKLVKNAPVWASHDGICNYSAGSITVISKDKLGKISIKPINAAVWDENYYLCLEDGTLLVMDGRFNVVFKTFSFANKILNILNYNDTLHFRIDTKLALAFIGDPIEFKFVSGRFTEDSHSQTKLYNNIYIRMKGSFIVRTYIDEVEVCQNMFTNIDEVVDIKPPAELQRGSDIQFEITGIGTIYEIEYKVSGRQNGR